MAVWYKVQNATINEGVQNPGAGMRDRRQAPARHGPNGIPPKDPNTMRYGKGAHARRKEKKERKKTAISMLEARGWQRGEIKYPRICEIMPPWCPGIILNGTPDRPRPPTPPVPYDSPASFAFHSRMLSFDALIQIHQGISSAISA